MIVNSPEVLNKNLNTQIYFSRRLTIREFSMIRSYLAIVVILPLVTLLADYGLHSTIAESQNRPTIPQLSLYRLDNIEIYDADTFTADVYLGFKVILTKQAIRVKDFDAWEISNGRRTVKVTSDEIKKGLEARDYVLDLLKKSTFKITDGNYDIYNRIVSDVYWLDTKKTPMEYALLSDTLRKRGFERSDPSNDRPASKN